MMMTLMITQFQYGEKPYHQIWKKMKMKIELPLYFVFIPLPPPLLDILKICFFFHKQNKKLITSQSYHQEKIIIMDVYLVAGNKNEKKQAIKIEIHFNFKMIDLCAKKIIHSINFKSILDSLYKHWKRQKLRS